MAVSSFSGMFAVDAGRLACAGEGAVMGSASAVRSMVETVM